MMLTLWPECHYDEEYQNCSSIMNQTHQHIFVATEAGECVGFIHMSLRKDHVEGASSSPVAYVEGIYVKPLFRKLGIAAALIKKGEVWASNNNCTQIASDTECANEASIAFHKSAGFEEVNRIVCFIKRIDQDEKN